MASIYKAEVGGRNYYGVYAPDDPDAPEDPIEWPKDAIRRAMESQGEAIVITTIAIGLSTETALKQCEEHQRADWRIRMGADGRTAMGGGDTQKWGEWWDS